MNMQSRFKKAALALAVIGTIGMSGPLMAQHAMIKFDAERMAERLELDTAQTEAITNLFEAHRSLMESLEWRTADGEPNSEARQQAHDAHQALNEEIKAILTEEQAEKFETRRMRRGHRHGKRGAFSGLDLSDEQREAITQIKAEHREQGRGDRGKMREAIHEILTDEQVAELEAKRERMPKLRIRGDD